MIEYDSANSPQRIIIPISGTEDVFRYQRGVLGILGKIKMHTCGPALKEDVKAVFELLGHMLSAENLQQFNEAGKQGKKQKQHRS
jgi:hypothetical protein